MAAPPPPSPSTLLPPLPTPAAADDDGPPPYLGKVSITQQQFNSFHNIDRRLFSRLVRGLRRDPGQSMLVMAFWLWLEQSRQSRELVINLLKWPDNLLTSLAEEAVLCLNCVDIDDFPPAFQDIAIPFTQSMTKSRVSLRFFRERRSSVLFGIRRIFSEVCERAFQDILQLDAMEKNAVFHHDNSRGNLGGGGRGGGEMFFNQQQQPQQQLNHLNHLGPSIGPALPPVINPALPPVMYYNPVVGDQLGQNQTVAMPQNFDNRGGFDVYDVEIQRQIFNNEIGDCSSGIQVSDNHDHDHQEIDQVAEDERTIFLTFSKGYPISQNEIRDFFSRSYGELIEAISMQEVAPPEQPLFALLVMNSDSSMEVILAGKSSVKFSINGKHVWAKKFVRKSESPSRSSSPVSAAATTASSSSSSSSSSSQYSQN